MRNAFRNLLRKSPSPAIAPIVRSPELQARADKLLPIVEAAGPRAVDQHSKKFAKLASSEKLQRQFELIDALSDEDFAMFLDILEAGVPDEFRHMLQE